MVIHKKTGRIIGATRYLNASAVHCRLEIGGTWYAKSYQRTAVNTTCKLLMLTHAFEQLQCTGRGI
ncbi:MAG: GNAT family protein [Saprospiraceae bacterium]